MANSVCITGLMETLEVEKTRKRISVNNSVLNWRDWFGETFRCD